MASSGSSDEEKNLQINESEVKSDESTISSTNDSSSGDCVIISSNDENENGRNENTNSSSLSDNNSNLAEGGKEDEKSSDASADKVKMDVVDSEETGKKLPETGSITSKPSRPAAQPTKRRPDKELNHDNWDVEDEPEEKGEFIKATAEQLKDRKILTAKRKQKAAGESSSNPFGAINLANAFGGSSSTNNAAVSMFNFALNAPSSTVPKFDFNSVSSSNTQDKQDDSTSVGETTSAKKLRREDGEEGVPAVGVNSATTA